MQDIEVVDYDMSSEEEWNEHNGEDLDKMCDLDSDSEKILIEREEAEEENQEKGFIVPDNYLS